jgi:hypothetical protein
LFTHKLEEYLNREGRRFLVLTAGVGGWGTVQQTTYARDHFEVFRPDYIVLTYCSNDPRDDVSYASDLSSGLLPQFPGKRFIRDHSALYGFLYGAFHDRLYAWVLRWRERHQPPAALPDQEQAAAAVQPENLASKQAPDLHEQIWNETLDKIIAFHETFLDFNPKGVFLVQTAFPWLEDSRRHLRCLNDHEGLVYVDLYDDTVNLPGEQLILPYDPHWTPTVHSISASNLCETILKREGRANE